VLKEADIAEKSGWIAKVSTFCWPSRRIFGIRSAVIEVSMTPTTLSNIIAPIAGFAALIGLFLASLRAVIALTPDSQE
jgi:hypothetical protein